MQSLKPILEKLSRTREHLLRASDRITPDQWQTRPEPAAWSAADVIAHLTTVERAVTEGASRVLQRPPKPLPFFRRLHLPVELVAYRGIRRRTPIPSDPVLLGRKEEMLAELRKGRERTLVFLGETGERDLRAYHWPHPFLGSLNIHEWFRVIAHHETRHAKQILEIVEKLQK